MSYQIATNEQIEDAVLPQRDSKKPCLEVANHRFIDIVGGAFVTKEFRDKYVKKTT